MDTINAVPKDVREIFLGQYVIPAFQRPYSWEEEQCEVFWDDIVDFHKSKPSREKYFLGNIVLHPFDEDDKKCSVIDGQQRLTTLLILIKALHKYASTVTALEECIKTKDPLTAELTPNLRIESRVIGKDKDNLKKLMLGDKIEDNVSRVVCNYNYFIKKIGSLLDEFGSSSEKFNNFILTLLDRVVLLPIECKSEDDALTIFETINNRGMSLSDSDIFKATLYAKVEDQKNFIIEWNLLDNHEELFRILMHVRRAEDSITGKEIALRAFFNAKSGQLNDVTRTIKSLKLINTVENSWKGTTKKKILWYILETFPNYYWQFPLYVFLHKHGKLNIEGEYELDVNKIEEFDVLMEQTVRYFFIKGLVYNSVNAVKDTSFKVSAAIVSDNDYLNEYKANIFEDAEVVPKCLEKINIGRYTKGLVCLAAYLNPQQDAEDFEKALHGSTIHVEHILPQKWANTNDWDKTVAEEKMNILGNLVPFESKLNISATNAFFGKKKDKYCESKIQDVKDLLPLKVWDKMEVDRRQAMMHDRLLKFFKSE